LAQFEQLNIHSFRNANSKTVQQVRLFECEELKAELVILPPGSGGEWHSHADSHELFDVLEGAGTFYVADRQFPGRSGKSVLVPAGVAHRLHNDGEDPWVLRVTYQKRIGVRHIGKLMLRSIRQQLGIQ
jgi:mannose-6-phosphate isomerase-like protein (cupin superfamily)